MRTVHNKNASSGYGRLIDLARAEPAAVAKHGRPVVVAMSVKMFERLQVADLPTAAAAAKEGVEEMRQPKTITE